jgi:hypothetical protein
MVNKFYKANFYIHLLHRQKSSCDQWISSFLCEIFGDEMFQTWSKQLENEDKGRVHEIRQSCEIWPAKFGQILLRTDTRLVFCNRKLMRTDISFTRTPNPYAILWTLYRPGALFREVPLFPPVSPSIYDFSSFYVVVI